MPNMIRVRDRSSGQETTVNEKAFGYFAANFDRIDDTPAEAPTPVEPPKIKRRGTAAQTEEE